MKKINSKELACRMYHKRNSMPSIGRVILLDFKPFARNEVGQQNLCTSADNLQAAARTRTNQNKTFQMFKCKKFAYSFERYNIFEQFII